MYYLNNTTYNEKTLMGRLRRYFLIYFETFSVSTADSLFLLIFSILALESAHSIRFLYHHFLSGITKKSLNVFYYACSYAKVDYSNFMNITARTALKLIPDPLKTHPVFLCVDDTMVSKSGKKFENVSKLFNHAAHNGSNYLNGHCFVSIMLCVPVLDHDKISYLSVPLGYRMWQKKESKLELAASMIRQVMPEFLSKEHVIILCDSWYTKKNLVSIIDEYPNLDLIGNARIDSVMYDLAPERTRRRGRPAKHGKRLFFSTIFSEDLKVFCTEEEHSSSDQTDHDPVNYIRCYYMPFDGRSKSATMNRKRSGLFATIWYGVARE